MISLTRRLLLVVASILLLFFAVAGLALDALFRGFSETSVRELLDAQMVALIAAAEPLPGQSALSASASSEARLQTPGSGLYAEIRQPDGLAVWRSGSTAGAFVTLAGSVQPGEARYADITTERGEVLAAAWRGVNWEFDRRASVPHRRSLNFVFAVATSRAPYFAELRRLRQQMLGASLVLALLLIGALLLALRSATRPLRQLEIEISDIEAGRRQALGQGYPRELAGVAANLNLLLDGERRRIARYRDNLADLAHSLKTPLAVLTSMVHTTRPVEAEVVERETEKMSALVSRHLTRAAMSGGVTLGQVPVEVAPLANDLRAAMRRVHAGKDLLLEQQVEPGATFLGDRTDFMELLGNLLDNACKWCRGSVWLRIRTLESKLLIEVEDDGPGMPPQLIEQGPRRGQRADENTPGHGYGLAMVQEVAESYGGSLTLARREGGGTRVSVLLPNGRSRR